MVSKVAKTRVAELIDAANWPKPGTPAAEWLNFDIVTPAVFARFVEQVSDVAKFVSRALTHHDNCTASADDCTTCGCGLSDALHQLAPFILPEARDELQEALRATFGGAAPEFVAAFRDELAKRGLQIFKVPA